MKSMERKLYIDGAWADAADGKRIAIADPATGAPVGSSALASRKDVDRAVEAAAKALTAWADTHPDQRARILHRAADLIAERVDAIAETLTREQGKPVPDAKKEILFGVEVIRFYAEEGRRLGGSIRPSSRHDIRNLVSTAPVVRGASRPRGRACAAGPISRQRRRSAKRTTRGQTAKKSRPRAGRPQRGEVP